MAGPVMITQKVTVVIYIYRLVLLDKKKYRLVLRRRVTVDLTDSLSRFCILFVQKKPPPPYIWPLIQPSISFSMALGSTHQSPPLMIDFLRQCGGFAVVDGGLATELERHGADLNDPLWSAKCLLTSPHLIRRVHFLTLLFLLSVSFFIFFGSVGSELAPSYWNHSILGLWFSSSWWWFVLLRSGDINYTNFWEIAVCIASLDFCLNQCLFN